MLEATGISHRVNGVVTLADTSIEVKAGEFVAIVGPNGAGKTTLMAMLAGELEPSTGTVTLAGKPLKDTTLEERSRLRAYLPPMQTQEIGFTVREVVAMGRHPWRDQDLPDDDLTEAALEAAGVASLAGRKLGSLSTGEAQLVQIARIFSQQAALLLLDEPTGGLDISHQERILRALASRADHHSVVAVLHDINAAASVADRMLIMSGGKAVAFGSPAQVLNEDLLSDVYDHPISVISHPFRDGPLVLVGNQTSDVRPAPRPSPQTPPR
ncbi:MAG TPA: ATP-binding cassette domain-containing protein [Acidimicrobiia bacterium]